MADVQKLKERLEQWRDVEALIKSGSESQGYGPDDLDTVQNHIRRLSDLISKIESKPPPEVENNENEYKKQYRSKLEEQLQYLKKIHSIVEQTPGQAVGDFTKEDLPHLEQRISSIQKQIQQLP